MWVSRKHYELLQRSEAFFRLQYLAERARADRLVDNTLEANAQLPVSAEAMARRDKYELDQVDLAAGMDELFATETEVLEEEASESTPKEEVN